MKSGLWPAFWASKPVDVGDLGKNCAAPRWVPWSVSVTPVSEWMVLLRSLCPCWFVCLPYQFLRAGAKAPTMTMRLFIYPFNPVQFLPLPFGAVLQLYANVQLLQLPPACGVSVSSGCQSVGSKDSDVALHHLCNLRSDHTDMSSSHLPCAP